MHNNAHKIEKNVPKEFKFGSYIVAIDISLITIKYVTYIVVISKLWTILGQKLQRNQNLG